MLTRDNILITYLDSRIFSHDHNVQVQGNELVRGDHPSKVKRGGLCIYYRKDLSLKLININFPNEYLTIELNIKNKICVLVVCIGHLVNHTTNFPVLLPT